MLPRAVLVDKARIVIVPLINVDSFVFTQQAFSPTDTYWYGNTPLQPLADQPVGGMDTGEALYTGEQAVGAQAYRRKTCSGAFPAGPVAPGPPGPIGPGPGRGGIRPGRVVRRLVLDDNHVDLLDREQQSERGNRRPCACQQGR